MEKLELIEPSEELQEELIAYIEEFRAASEPFWEYERDQVRNDFASYIRQSRDRAAGRNLPEGHVPWSEFWLVRGGRRIIGTIRLRHRLNEALTREGGHFGYDVRSSERGKGYATRMLAMALDKAKEMGLKRVLITCDKDNAASARVIQKNGGMLGSEDISNRTGKPIRRYWIDL